MTQKIRKTIRKTSEHKQKLAESFRLLTKQDKTRESTSAHQIENETTNMEADTQPVFVKIKEKAPGENSIGLENGAGSPTKN